jgi:hypothetical protein
MKAGRNEGTNIFFGLIEKAAVLDARVGRCKKEKGSGPKAQAYPNDIDGKVYRIKAPVLPVKKPDKERAISLTLYPFHIQPLVELVNDVLRPVV